MFLDLDKKDRAAVAVIDDSGAQLTYGEICDFSAECRQELPPGEDENKNLMYTLDINDKRVVEPDE